jgi:hypothetical protein
MPLFRKKHSMAQSLLLLLGEPLLKFFQALVINQEDLQETQEGSLDSQDKNKALEALDKAIGQGYASGYQDLIRRIEAAGKKEKAAFFMKNIPPSN